AGGRSRDAERHTHQEGIDDGRGKRGVHRDGLGIGSRDGRGGTPATGRGAARGRGATTGRGAAITAAQQEDRDHEHAVPPPAAAAARRRARGGGYVARDEGEGAGRGAEGVGPPRKGAQMPAQLDNEGLVLPPPWTPVGLSSVQGVLIRWKVGPQ